MPSTTERPALIVLGAGDRDRWAFTLEQITAVQPVLLLDSDPPAWVWPYVAGVWAVDLTDGVAVAAAVRHLAQDRGVLGIGTYLEHHVEFCAHLTEDLGLPSAGVLSTRTGESLVPYSVDLLTGVSLPGAAALPTASQVAGSLRPGALVSRTVDRRISPNELVPTGGQREIEADNHCAREDR
ncbi:hypothetical protein [Streptomyces chattanoogensis]|uniref:hypothetical protein n=1 Tax=Streptomyces chattanoogensis TaxID=66876 RepID=UPI00367D5FEF